MTKYTLENIIRLYEFGQDLDYLFFWGHTPNKNQPVGNWCFSQWYPTTFEVKDQTYLTSEQWMMAEKARLFKDVDMLENVLNAKNAAQVKDFGRRIRNFDDVLWNEHRFEIVRQGNYHKFIQNDELKHFLLSTKDKVIVEASPLDPIWGIGLAKDNPQITNPNYWKGLNLLGFALMEVRDQLRILETALQFNATKNSVTLYRPVGPKELALIKESKWRRFPARLPEQPFFYPVLNEEYAIQIAKDWNVPSDGSGFVTKFEIDKRFMLNYTIQNVGEENHLEIWIPAQELEEFNNHIVGKIEITKEFKIK